MSEPFEHTLANIVEGVVQSAGFYQMPNALEDALLSSPLTFRQERVFRAVLRKTLGFNKPSDCIATSQLSAMTGIDVADVRKALNDLVGFRMIERGRRTKLGAFLTPVLVPVEWALQTGRITLNTTLNRVNHPAQTGRITPHKIQLQNTKKTKPVPVEKGDTPAAKPASRKRSATLTLSEWMTQEREAGRELLSADDPLFASECDRGKLPVEYITLCWHEFVARHIESRKRQADWRQTFRNCVRQDWYKLWAIDRNGVFFLTTAGKMAERRHAEGEAA
ncbi:replication protein [Crenobacter intestini]|uniref:Bacteriophage lambda Replication protein O N-terminal domain-containing protein n=1 Tax=Crenobacter intestini TaxID=2563443 RepID=A0A4T0UJC5_9NEIS|nr:replication protein [Crenobacter intestini]TIC78421.1 hypothetical protein E5K04_16390 [Crenobacter intestini]